MVCFSGILSVLPEKSKNCCSNLGKWVLTLKIGETMSFWVVFMVLQQKLKNLNFLIFFSRKSWFWWIFDQNGRKNRKNPETFWKKWFEIFLSGIMLTTQKDTHSSILSVWSRFFKASQTLIASIFDDFRPKNWSKKSKKCWFFLQKLIWNFSFRDHV